MRDSVKFIPSGVLDMDSAPEYVKQGDYTDAKNVTHITNNTESTQSITPVYGNEEAFDLGSVSVQNKTWRITTPQDATNILGGIFLYDQNGNLFPTIGGQVQPMEWNRNQTLANQRTAIAAMFTIIDGAGNTVVTAVGTDYITITTDTVNGYDIGLDARTASHASPIFKTDTSLSPIVIQEAYDTTLTGELNKIDSFDLNGDMYVRSTTGVNMPTTISATISAITISGSKFRITANAHGLTNGQKIVTSGIIYTGATTPALSPNGIFIVSGVTTNTFDLNEWYGLVLNTFVYTPSGIITLYTEAIGEIGMAQKDENLVLPLTNQWSYKRLLRTKEWNFRESKRGNMRSFRNSLKDTSVWTDGLNNPRCFYYNTPFVLDGALSINGGRYEYGSIASETKLILSTTGTKITYVSQDQSGGALTSGNKRYTHRLLSDSLTNTEWGELTNPIPVFSAPTTGDPSLIIGDEPGTVTGKRNNLKITGIVPGLFKYVELGVVNYVGDAIEGFVVKRVLLDSSSTEVTIAHTGTEIDTTLLDLGTINFKEANIDTAESIDIVSSRVVLSNITLAQQKDFTTVSQTITYSINRKALKAVRSATDGTIVMGEYQDPTNVNMYCGLMHNETYRGGIKYRMKSGIWTDTFWVDDYKIDCTSSGRKTSNLTDFNLTDNTLGGADDIVYSAYVSYNITTAFLDTLIDGIKLRDLVDAISFQRAEVVPTVLACGIGILGVSGVAASTGESIEDGFDPGGAADTFRVSTNLVIGVTDANLVMEFPWASGRTNAALLGTNPAYNLFPSGGGFDKYTQRREYASFYSSDLQFNHSSISFLPGDVVINYGNPAYISFVNAINSDSKRCDSNYAQYSGRTNKNDAGATNPDIVTLTEAALITKGGSFVLPTAGTQTFNKTVRISRTVDNVQGTCDNPTGMVFLANGAPNFNNPASLYFLPADHGVYYMQYYRSLLNQYGDKSNTKYVSTGHFFEINSGTASSSQDVFGGDTFTQANYFRHRFASTIDNGLGGGIMFYSQNRINLQLKNKGVGQIANFYPSLGTDTWLETQTVTNETYNEGYTIRNQVRSDIAFDSNAERVIKAPARVQYSETMIENSTSSNERVFLPLNFRDLSLSNGEITSHINHNGELLTFQPKRIELQYLNTRGELQISGAGTAIIGDGKALSREGQSITSYGCSSKYSIIKGKSKGGDDIELWIDIILKKVFRLGQDGTLCISDQFNMASFFANNLTWVTNANDIVGVWNERFKQAVWTVRAKRTVTAWSSATTYSIGQVVDYTPATFTTFEKTGEFYKSLQNSNTNHNPESATTWWEVIPHTNTDYYNEYTVCFNENKKGFTTFDTLFIPKVYSQYKDTVLSHRPISPVSKAYEHNKGSYLTAYLYSGVSKTERGYIECVINKFNDQAKTFVAYVTDSKVVPDEVQFTTDTQKSYLLSSEFETNEGSHYSEIKADSTITGSNPSGLNNTDADLLSGRWLKSKFFFAVNTYNSYLNSIVEFYFNAPFKGK